MKIISRRVNEVQFCLFNTLKQIRISGLGRDFSQVVIYEMYLLIAESEILNIHLLGHAFYSSIRARRK